MYMCIYVSNILCFIQHPHLQKPHRIHVRYMSYLYIYGGLSTGLNVRCTSHIHIYRSTGKITGSCQTEVFLQVPGVSTPHPEVFQGFPKLKGHFFLGGGKMMIQIYHCHWYIWHQVASPAGNNSHELNQEAIPPSPLGEAVKRFVA